MKIAVISDLHFGDDQCVLVVKPKDEPWRLQDGVEDALDFLKELDVLVLLGDVFDLSIASYEKAFAASRPFFDHVKKCGVTKIVYAPGNHDVMLWHAIEYETRITRPLASNERCAKSFRASLPAIIRTEADPGKSVELPGVTPPLGTVFLRDFALGIPVIVAYPNVYIVSQGPKTTVLLTHGQYLEAYWAFGGELVHNLAGDDLRLGPALSLKQIVDFNHPLSQLACTGIGQAGALTELARAIQREVKDHQTGPRSKTDRYLRRLERKIDDYLSFSGMWGRVKELATDKCLDYALKAAREQLDQVEKARDNRSWLFQKEVRGRFVEYFEACLAEVDAINKETAQPIPSPTAVVLGHTHVQEPWSTPLGRISNTPVEIANTGGWLDRRTAHVVSFDGEKFSSRDVFEQLPSTKAGPA